MSSPVIHGLALYLALFATAVTVRAQRPVGATPATSGTVAQQVNTIRNQAVGRGYSIADTNRIGLAGVRPLQVQNLSGSNFADSPLRGVASNSIARPSVSPSQPAQRPFSNINRQPTVSPYLLLFNDENDNPDNDFNYQTLVRPLLQQQEFNQQINRQQQQLNMEVSALSARSDYNQTGSQQITPTGHPTVFNNTLNFYPARNRR